MRAILGSLSVLAAGLAIAAARPAAADVPLTGELVAEAACQAFQSIRNRTNPGDVVTVAGTRYPALGLNKAGGDWVKVLVRGAQPQDRWVHRGCGALELAEDEDSVPPGGGGDGAGSTPVAGGFAPFFDDVDQGPRDATPPPPPLDAFDRAVLEVCGPWGSSPKAAAFRAMLDRPELAADVAAMHGALGGGVGEAAVGLDGFKDQLADVWFEEHGFAHIFCGEPSSGDIGGLHFRGRYLELQQLGLAGQMTDRECRKTEIEPPVYTFGVRYRTARGRIGSACPKGYGYDLGARDLFVQATAAYEAMADVGGKKMCLKQVATAGGPGYLAVFVIKNGAVRTFYPDASPQCDGGGSSTSGCACG